MFFRFLSTPEQSPKSPKIENVNENKKFDIKSDDIIEADFEEIKNNDTKE